MELRNILLVEDNADDEQLILMSLKAAKIGNEITVARDGREALDLLLGKPGEEPPVLPAVVLLDLHLPKIDGLDVLAALRAEPRTKLLPVVVLTSSDEERDRVESYGRGCNSYVCKPVDFKQFSSAVKELGLYWLLLNQPPQ